MNEDWKKQLFDQKSLWEIYRLSHKVFPRPKFNRVAFWISLVSFTGLMFGPTFLFRLPYRLQDSAEFVTAVAERLFGLSIGILGFLIAGFAIFASITNVKLFITLAQIPYVRDKKEQGISQLQYVFFNFLNVFTFYMTLLAVCTLLLLLFSKGSPIAELNDRLSTSYPLTALITNCGASTLLLTAVISGLLKLKSFIWNLYQAALLSIVTEKPQPEPSP